MKLKYEKMPRSLAIILCLIIGAPILAVITNLMLLVLHMPLPTDIFYAVTINLGFTHNQGWLTSFIIFSALASIMHYIGFCMLKDTKYTFSISAFKVLAKIGYCFILAIYLVAQIWCWSILIQTCLNDIPFSKNLLNNIQIILNKDVWEYEYGQYNDFIWQNIFLFCVSVIIYEVIHMTLIRTIYPKYIEPYFEKITNEKVLSSKEGESILSSAGEYNEIKKLLHKLKLYKPNKYFKKHKAFLAKDINSKKPIYINDQEITEKRLPHFAVVGASGSGKGIFSQNFLVQMLQKGFPVIVFDPNEDEHMMKNLKYHADQMGKQFHWVNFSDYKKPQIDLLQKCNSYEFIQLTNTLFPSLKIRASEGNYYAQFPRYAREFYADDVKGSTCMYALHKKIFKKYGEDMLKDDDGMLPQFVQEFLSIAKIPMMRVSSSISIQEVINQGDVLYISCPDLSADDELALLCKALFLRVLQVIKNRQMENAKHVFMFIDEFAEFANKTVKSAIEQVRKKGCTLLMNMTSFESLNGINKDVDGQAFVDTVKINSIKLIYQQPHEAIADKVSRMTGEKIIKIEREHVQRNDALKEIKNKSEAFQFSSKVPLYSATLLENLPAKVGVLLGLGLPKIVQTEVLAYPKNVTMPAQLKAEVYPLAKLELHTNSKEKMTEQDDKNGVKKLPNDLMEAL